MYEALNQGNTTHQGGPGIAHWHIHVIEVVLPDGKVVEILDFPYPEDTSIIWRCPLILRVHRCVWNLM